MTDKPEVVDLVSRVGIAMWDVADSMEADCRPEWEAMHPVSRQELFEAMARAAISIIFTETKAISIQPLEET